MDQNEIQAGIDRVSVVDGYAVDVNEGGAHSPRQMPEARCTGAYYDRRLLISDN